MSNKSNNKCIPGTDTVSVNHVDIDGNSAIHYAAYNGLLKCVRKLISLGAIISIVNKLQMTCCEMADEGEYKDLANVPQNYYAQNIYEFISSKSNQIKINYTYKREATDPQVFIKKITDLCLSAKVKIQIEIDEDAYHVYLFNLKAYSKEQAALKEMANLNQNIQGNIKISIGK
jgi:ankyrin repeat protein